MKTNETRTVTRVWWTVEYFGLWKAYFQPLNKKTGKPWQAGHELSDGWDAHVLGNYHTGATTPAQPGSPTFEEWHAQGWTSCIHGYATEAQALGAIARAKAKLPKALRA